jgi:hypothetical protein
LLQDIRLVGECREINLHTVMMCAVHRHRFNARGGIGADSS